MNSRELVEGTCINGLWNGLWNGLAWYWFPHQTLQNSPVLLPVWMDVWWHAKLRFPREHSHRWNVICTMLALTVMMLLAEMFHLQLVYGHKLPQKTCRHVLASYTSLKWTSLLVAVKSGCKSRPSESGETVRRMSLVRKQVLSPVPSPYISISYSIPYSQKREQCSCELLQVTWQHYSFGRQCLSAVIPNLRTSFWKTWRWVSFHLHGPPYWL